MKLNTPIMDATTSFIDLKGDIRIKEEGLNISCSKQKKEL